MPGCRPALLIALAVVLLTGDPASAQFASERDRQDAWRYYRAGQELMTAERFEQAADAYQAAIQKDRLLTLAHYGLGQAYMELRRFASAAQAFRGCRDAFETLYGLARTERVAVERRRDDEIRELRDAMRRMQQAGTSVLRITNIERRVNDLDRQRTVNPGGFVPPAEVSLALGSAHFRNNQPEDAEREWQAAVAANGRMGEAHNNLAALYAARGRRKEAEREVKEAEKAGFRVNPGLKDQIRTLK